MKIAETDISDKCIVTDESAYKIILMEKIIEYFVPLFSNEVDRKKSQLNENLEDISRLKNSISEIKDKLKMWLTKIQLEKIRKEVITEILLLQKKDLIYGKIKQLVKDILFSIESKDRNEISQDLLYIKNVLKSSTK